MTPRRTGRPARSGAAAAERFISVRVTEAEYEALSTAAAAAGQSMSEFLRGRALASLS